MIARLLTIALCLCVLGCASTQADSLATGAIGFGCIDTLAISANVYTWHSIADSTMVIGPIDSVWSGVQVEWHEKPTTPGEYVYTLRIDTTYEQITVDLYRRVIDTVETWRKKESVPESWYQLAVPTW